jgi:hypothetical protein
LVNFNVRTPLSATKKADASQCPREAPNDEPSRSKAIRRLIEIALTKSKRQSSCGNAPPKPRFLGITRRNHVDEDLRRCRFVQLFGSYIRGPHHFGPLLGISYEQSFKLTGRPFESCATELAEPRIEGGNGKSRINLFVELTADVLINNSV